MELVAKEIAGYLQNSSMIRRMFEAGIELKKQYGADKVYDFSLGNPDLPPPPAVGEALAEIARHASDDFAFGYMPNAGYPETRRIIAENLASGQDAPVTANEVLLTCGAAGALNVFFRAVLEEDDEVMVPAPYFVEYGFYCGNYGGKLRPVPAREPDFHLDLAAMESAITAKTRAVILNSPNNPTGVIYTAEELQGLAAILERKSKQFGRTIYVVSDEPYVALNYSGSPVPAMFRFFNACVIAGSFSKTLSLAGERIGYLAVNPALAGRDQLVSALILANRILGFVNAPAIAQKLVAACISSSVALEIYRRRRDLMAEVLRSAGIEFTLPQGAFYFFAKCPTPDDKDFVQKLLDERILAVPGSGFGKAGYIRLAFCVPESSIRNAAPGFAAAMKHYR